jgi:hypothetical protein
VPAVTTDVAPDWTATWVEALDRLELDVEQAEQMLTHASVSAARAGQAAEQRWVAPVSFGPLPESLYERAMQVNARQLEVARKIVLALGATRRESDLAHRLSPNGHHATPMYVDHLM